MNLDIEGILSRYNTEIARLTQRAIIAEARADAAEKQSEEDPAT